VRVITPEFYVVYMTVFTINYLGKVLYMRVLL